MGRLKSIPLQKTPLSAYPKTGKQETPAVLSSSPLVPSADLGGPEIDRSKNRL
jgi:hypothetical protein